MWQTNGPVAGGGGGGVLVEPIGPNLMLLKVTVASAALVSTSLGTPEVVAHAPCLAPGAVLAAGKVLSSQVMLKS